LGPKSKAEVLIRWWGCLVGQHNVMGPEVRLSFSYIIANNDVVKEGCLTTMCCLESIINDVKCIPHCTKQCPNIRSFKKVPFTRSVLSANNYRCFGRYKKNTEYGKLTPGTDI